MFGRNAEKRGARGNPVSVSPMNEAVKRKKQFFDAFNKFTSELESKNLSMNPACLVYLYFNDKSKSAVNGNPFNKKVMEKLWNEGAELHFVLYDSGSGWNPWMKLSREHFTVENLLNLLNSLKNNYVLLDKATVGSYASRMGL